MNSARTIGFKKFEEKPIGYEANFESTIYADGFVDGVVYILEELKKKFAPSSLDTFHESIENAGMQELISKMREGLQC